MKRKKEKNYENSDFIKHKCVIIIKENRRRQADRKGNEDTGRIRGGRKKKEKKEIEDERLMSAGGDSEECRGGSGGRTARNRDGNKDFIVLQFSKLSVTPVTEHLLIHTPHASTSSTLRCR